MRIRRWNPILLVLLSIAIPAGIPMGIAAAHSQPQDDALADAARRAQAEKKTQPTQQKVWTNENIPTTPGAISIVGTVLPTPAEGNASNPAGAAPAAVKAGAPANSGESHATVQAELDAAKLDLNTATTDLDILTRKHTLDSQTYYGKPDYESDTEGAAQLKDEQDEIDAKKQQVDDAQKKVSDLQSELDASSTGQDSKGDSSNSTGATASGNSTSDTSSTNSTGDAPGASSGGASGPPSSSSTTPPN